MLFVAAKPAHTTTAASSIVLLAAHTPQPTRHTCLLYSTITSLSTRHYLIVQGVV
jgi:hypothetical protein